MAKSSPMSSTVSATVAGDADDPGVRLVDVLDEEQGAREQGGQGTQQHDVRGSALVRQSEGEYPDGRDTWWAIGISPEHASGDRIGHPMPVDGYPFRVGNRFI
ncbi:hypothetical protein [Streptomyces marianii]|uniref:Uncharacterized protein n=1 Tax=Streptomyces marianii TaxID=1817406 RepID=A0A5R9DWL6_9ACTN|nr:hypothetical protein [Streptomyces marianii]TLQ41978.1 hypothetical protein FEF34_00625 [Streptomyces marianii]